MYLFMNEAIGLNFIVFQFISLVLVLILDRKLWQNSLLIPLTVWVLAVFSALVWGGFFSWFAVLVVFVYLISAISGASFSSVYYYLLLPFMSLPEKGSYLKLACSQDSKPKSRKFGFEFYIIPVVILIVFYIMYANALSGFEYVNNEIGESIELFFEQFNVFNFVFYLIFGAVVSLLLLFPVSETFKNLMNFDRSFLMFLKRKKEIFKTNPPMGLRMQLLSEFKVSKMILISVSILLTVALLSEMGVVLSHTEIYSAAELSRFVHSSTHILLVSIVLTMILLHIFFANKLNFYSKNEVYFYAAYYLIFLNVLLVMLLLYRNSMYVYSCGLSYKRVSVFVFIVCVVYSLVTVFYKLLRKQSLYGWFKNLTWGLALFLVLVFIMPWNQIIVRYNLNFVSPEQQDIEYLKSLGIETYPYLYQHQLLTNETTFIEYNRVRKYELDKSWKSTRTHILLLPELKFNP